MALLAAFREPFRVVLSAALALGSQQTSFAGARGAEKSSKRRRGRMARHYQLKEPEYVRQAITALIAMKLEVEETNLVLYRPLPAPLRTVFQRALERIEAGIPFSEIPELPKVRAHLDSERETRRDFARFKEEYHTLSLKLAEAEIPPNAQDAQALFALISNHPALAPTSTTARQMAHDFARYPNFTASEYLDARYLAELQDYDWVCPFWLARFHDSLRTRYLDPQPDSEAIGIHAEVSFRSTRFPWDATPRQIAFDSPPRLLFAGRTFLFTGKFQFGSRKKCREAVVSRNGQWEENMNRAVDCLVVAGSGDSTDQCSSKISRWAELRSKGWPCLLISEEKWCEALKAR